MIRKQVLGSIGVLMSVFLLASSVEDIDMDTGEELPVVVDCVLQMDTVQTLRLYHMKPLNANGDEPVTEAKVELQRIQKNGSFFKVAEFQRSEGLGWNKVVVQKEKNLKYCNSVSLFRIYLIRVPGLFERQIFRKEYQTIDNNSSYEEKCAFGICRLCVSFRIL